MFCTAAIARTINWYVDGSVYQTTTCNSGDGVTPPTPPAKYGYTFQGWEKYVRIEYIESTGTQYIDTGFKPNQDTRIVMEYMVTTYDAEGWIFGARYSSYGLLYTANRAIRSDYASELNGPNLRNGFYNDKLKVDKNKNKTTVYDSNEFVLANLTNPSATFQTGYNLLICGLSNNGTPAIFPANMRVYSFQLYDNGILVRDFIPVLDQNDTSCLYDKVSKTLFYNAGTGDFIAGPMVGE